MRYILFDIEKDINVLAARAFRLQGNDVKAAGNAAAALLKANPQLSDLSKANTGTVIAVPDNGPAITSDDQTALATGICAATAQAVQTAANTLEQRLTALETAATNRLTAGIRRVQASNLKTLLPNAAAQSPQLAKQMPNLDDIAASAAALTKSVQAARTARTQSLTQLTAVLASISAK
jgi:hypothetical protein